ncbi:2-oxoglutarate ferredoxin oxidoreductase subunit beta [Daejeonella rubra]|uniref:2-oxoglutarate ferredoxin oxidoreductase subunit beta n=1 Tax=Daejeonella rubra TaxID=990371 RepID=A0A1G9T6R8_9SPHI|nr:2-oxoacid:ferredoxin oxidoreductase subunit beta [Daejeonella rubra]SDM43423.1 2-oxoglutarate ferredoxin oxidoreductase subunit beta [Daejeonella rubra]
MTYIRPKFRHPDLPKNDLGYTTKEYEGSLSTLCAGCGHDSISASIIEACFELSIPPHRIAKLSGIGCSSKTPTYFLGNSHGFNSVHGRMPSVATGANMANRELTYIGVSGDGDTASIGMGQFVHVIRRNLNMVYIVMNNGCYGLTKGQDSATADEGSKSKAGSVNPFQPIDLAGLALELGASFVAQSFSGDKQQLIPLIKAAISHQGFAFINVISPCVTFNNNPGSTKSYDYVREHIESTGKTDLVPEKTEILTSYESGTGTNVMMHDGTYIRLEKLASNRNPFDRMGAMNALQNARNRSEILTGLLFVEKETENLHQTINSSDRPLNTLMQEELCPGSSVLADINDELR